jgi:alanine-synthesizing transaminase
MFSNRTSWELGENDFAARARVRRASAIALLDLTVSNPTHCGFRYDAQLLAPLSRMEALHYDPDPFGMLSAREAVAAYYRDHGASISTNRVCLTTSTSEAYSFLFRLLCDPGDNVLIAQPSYPLFGFIAGLDNVELLAYPLHYDPAATPTDAHAWSIDFAALRQAITPRTRAIIAVHPNNPTGNFVSPAEAFELEKICAENDLALIVDEVFLDYAHAAFAQPSFAVRSSAALTFVLSGISKVCGLPQMKASWIAASGPVPRVDSALARLEVIADTFLSMSAPIQCALSTWLASRHTLQQQILTRIATNLAVLDARLVGTQGHRLAVEGGWTAIVRVPRTFEDVPFAEAALERGVLVQPAEFYCLPEGRIVLSLLTPTEIWAAGLERLPL